MSKYSIALDEFLDTLSISKGEKKAAEGLFEELPNEIEGIVFTMLWDYIHMEVTERVRSTTLTQNQQDAAVVGIKNLVYDDLIRYWATGDDE